MNIEQRIRRLEWQLAEAKEHKERIKKGCTYIGDRLLSEMQLKGVTTVHISNETGLSRATISNYIHNKREIPAVTLGQIAKILNVSCDYLIYGERGNENAND